MEPWITSSYGRFGPFVLRIAPSQLAAHAGVVALPEAREVGRNLDGAVVGRQQVEHERHAAGCDTGPLAHPEEVLEPRRDPRRIADVVGHAHLASAGERDALGRGRGDEPQLLAGEAAAKAIDELARSDCPPKLRERPAPLAQLPKALAR